MKRYLTFLLVILTMLVFVSCSKDDKDAPGAAHALAKYWENQTNMTGSMENRDGIMHEIQAKINALGNAKTQNSFAEIDALVDSYIQQSATAAKYFDDMRKLENDIRPYGDDKGFFGDVAKGIYKKAGDAVVSSGQMVRSGWRVLSGSKSLREVLQDPDSGIPIVSSFAADLQRHNADRDLAIRQSILAGDSQEGFIPINALPGLTMTEKANAYLNLDDDDPLKKKTRGDVLFWDDGERTRTANTARKLGETGVKIVGDSYGGGQGEWTNEILMQHLGPNQDPADKGSMEIKIKSAETGNPSISGAKTIIIDKVNTPNTDPRVTIIMGAPATLVQELPSGDYNIIAVADEFIRNVEGAVTVIRSQVTEQLNHLLRLADNAIIIEGISAKANTITLGEIAEINLVCAGILGQNLDFAWEVAGGAYTALKPKKNQLTFKPSAEGEYIVACTVSDSDGNTKHASITVSVVDARLSFVRYQFITEDISDSKLNPGEYATVRFDVKNIGNFDLLGTTALETQGGIEIDYASTLLMIPKGETSYLLATIQVPANYSEANAHFNFKYLVDNQVGDPVLITVPMQIPVEFYVKLDPITTMVTNRLLTIKGTVANPLLTSANLILDGDSQQAYNVEINQGRFAQQVVVGSSTGVQQHSVRLRAVSGSLEAVDNITFNSQIEPTAMRVTLTWDTGGTDVDLWVTDPNGAKCYWANSTTNSGLELDIDDTDGYGPENITTTNIIPGTYLVQVHYYSDHDVDHAIGTNCTVVIRLNEGTPQETVTNYYGFLGDTGAMWDVTELNFDGDKWTLDELAQMSVVDLDQLPKK